MARYWWVNHRQTKAQEIGGRYLWSPKTRADGARNQFYVNMRRAAPGDLVLSYADGQIGHVGRVAEYAVTAPKPLEFGETGANWSNEGWYLPVVWTPLTPPVRPKEMLQAIAPLLPKKYAPIQAASGNGLQSVYLAEISEPLFDTVVAGALHDNARLAAAGANSLAFPVLVEQLDDEAEIRLWRDRTLDETTRKTVIQARRGQGDFRRNVMAVERRCRVTGIDNPALLIASHIKPWRVCKTAAERLDGMNGLMLTPDADLLFDRGFITFQDDGRVQVSERTEPHDLRRLGLGHLDMRSLAFGESQGLGHLDMRSLAFGESQGAWSAAGFAEGQRGYLAYHRAEVFVGAAR